MDDKPVRIAGYVAEVAPKTRWIFIEVETASGLTGVGEASLNGRERDVLQVAESLAEPLFVVVRNRAHSLPPGTCPKPPRSRPSIRRCGTSPDSVRDVRCELLGGPKRETVPLYANINRRTNDRSPPVSLRARATRIAAGFEAIKIAPFDEVMPPCDGSCSAIDRADRVAAAGRRSAGSTLMVDCHWRLTSRPPPRDPRGGGAAASTGSSAHCRRQTRHLDALRRLRGLANARGVRLAGCEHGIGDAGFAPFLRAGAYDAMMPDAKYVGGLAEMLRLSEVFAQAGVAFSPHNPTGPVCHAASLQICAAAPSFDRLELQFDETPLFAALAGGTLPEPSGGNSALPKGAGLGLTLSTEALQSCEVLRFERRKGA